MVKALHYMSEGPGIDSLCRRGFFPWHPTVPCALGSTQPLQMSTRIILGRCVRLTTYHLYVPTVKKSGGLNLLELCGLVQACNRTVLPFYTELTGEFQTAASNGLPVVMRSYLTEM